jgi:hypothetical protein
MYMDKIWIVFKSTRSYSEGHRIGEAGRLVEVNKLRCGSGTYGLDVFIEYDEVEILNESKACRNESHGCGNESACTPSARSTYGMYARPILGMWV